jgi:4-alpha-glucanotransferase
VGPSRGEDLGLITPDVTALRDQFRLPGMRVLQFAFDGKADNPYLPDNYVPNTVVYTGTHDNPTTRLVPRRYQIEEQQRMRIAGCSKRSRRLESGSDEKQATAVPVGRGDQQPSDRGRKRAQ